MALVNYRPGANGPNPMAQTPMNAAQVDADLTRIAALHANAVRLVMDYRTVPNGDAQTKLETFLEIAQRHGLRTQLTLFDQYAAYDAGWSEWWAQQLLQPFAGDRRIAFVELQNEMDPNNSAAMSWAGTMIPFLRGLGGGMPITVSEGGWCTTLQKLSQLRANLQGSPPDFWDVHYYCEPGAAATTLRGAAALVAPAPVIVGETGYSTVVNDSGSPGSAYGSAWQEAEQAFFFSVVESAAAAAGMPYAAPWMDSDIAPSSCQGCLARELHFGFFRLDGTAKPAVSVISSIFSGVPVKPDLNLGFEDDAGGNPAQWALLAPRSATFGHVQGFAHSGSWSVRIANASRDPQTGSAPSWVAGMPGQLTAGQAYTASSWVFGQNIDGPVAVIVIWNDTQGNGLGYVTSSPYPVGGGSGWLNLAVTSVAPQGAAFAQVGLMSLAGHGTAFFDDVSFQ